MQPVHPTRPAAGYIGGKRNLARRLVALIGSIPHDAYAEAFVGMGGIFLRRDHRPDREVINDASGDVVTFFRILQEHYPYFLNELRFRVSSRAEFERLRAIPPERLTDLQRAVRFLYLQRLAFGGKVSGRHFGVAPGQSARFNVNRLEPMLADIHDRLAHVVIEQMQWDAFVRRYDRPGTLFYLDPPYFGCEDDYGAELFDRAELERMPDVLSGIRGQFVLSINDHPEVRRLFGRFHLTEVDTTYAVGGGAAIKRVGELIITNLRDATNRAV